MQHKIDWNEFASISKSLEGRYLEYLSEEETLRGRIASIEFTKESRFLMKGEEWDLCAIELESLEYLDDPSKKVWCEAEGEGDLAFKPPFIEVNKELFCVYVWEDGSISVQHTEDAPDEWCFKIYPKKVVP